MVLYGIIWYIMVWYAMVWYCTLWFAWFSVVWYGMVWYGMVWYGMVWCSITSIVFSVLVRDAMTIAVCVVFCCHIPYVYMLICIMITVLRILDVNANEQHFRGGK
jgi:hypothetical protein